MRGDLRSKFVSGMLKKMQTVELQQHILRRNYAKIVASFSYIRAFCECAPVCRWLISDPKYFSLIPSVDYSVWAGAPETVRMREYEILWSVYIWSVFICVFFFCNFSSMNESHIYSHQSDVLFATSSFVGRASSNTVMRGSLCVWRALKLRQFYFFQKLYNKRKLTASRITVVTCSSKSGSRERKEKRQGKPGRSMCSNWNILFFQLILLQNLRHILFRILTGFHSWWQVRSNWSATR